MTKLIVICMEIYNREFLGNLLLALKLNLNKYKVIITYERLYCTHFNILSKHLPKSSFILYKSCDKVTYEHNFCKKGTEKLNIIILDAEAGGFLDSWYYINNRCYGDSLLKVRKIFNWGKEENELLSNKFPEKKNKFVVTGNPRFDILKCKNIFELETNNLKKKFGKYVLVIGFFKSDKILLSHLKDGYKMLNSNQEISKFEKNIIYTTKVLELFKILVKNLCKRYSDTTFIWKMHPRTFKQINRCISQDHLDLNNFFKNINNFKLLATSEMVEPLILGSQYVLHCNSTCGYQSCLLSKNNINFKPIINDFCSVTTNKHTAFLTGYICRNDIEVFKLIDSKFQEKLEIDNNKLQNKIYNFNSDTCSSSKIITEINKLSKEESSISNNDNGKELNKMFKIHVDSRVFAKNEKYQSFNKKEIINYIEKIKQNYSDLNNNTFDIIINKNSIIFN